MCLLCNHKDLSLDSHILQKNLDVAESICKANLEGRGQEVLTQGSLEFAGPQKLLPVNEGALGPVRDPV